MKSISLREAKRCLTVILEMETEDEVPVEEIKACKSIKELDDLLMSMEGWNVNYKGVLDLISCYE